MNHMHRPPHHDHMDMQNTHTNAFLILHGVPYVLGEYLDRRSFQQLDRSMIRSEVNIDNKSEAMRTIVDIQVDDIGKRCSDGLLNTEGNNSKQRRLIQCIQDTRSHTQGQLEMIPRGIVLQVEYQLENPHTGSTIRSTKEELFIADRRYFTEINPRNINDNAVVTNFSDTIVSTMNTFTHGMHPMILRIKGVQMYYRCMRRDRVPQSDVACRQAPSLPTSYGDEYDYFYHREMQSRQIMGHPGCSGDNFGSYGHEDVGAISNPSWEFFNRFYHFDCGGRDLVLHQDEIYHPNAATFKVPCGRIDINRTFVVNPGQRIVFRFSVWKNDLVVVNDTTPIMHALNAPLCGPNCMYPHLDCNRPVPPDHEINPDYEHVIQMVHDSMVNTNRQNYVINQLTNQLQYIQGMLEQMSKPTPPEKPEEEKPTGAVIADGKAYSSIMDALEDLSNAKGKLCIHLMEDLVERVVIRGEVELNLNNHTISAPADADGIGNWHTIIVDGGTLNIKGPGCVMNPNPDGCAVINLGDNDSLAPSDMEMVGVGNGIVRIDGGRYINTYQGEETPNIGIMTTATIDGGEEDLDDDEPAGDPSMNNSTICAVIVNHGVSMTIQGAVNIVNNDEDRIPIVNGYDSQEASSPCMMTIRDAKVKGGRIILKNAYGGRMTIDDGVYIMDVAIGDTPNAYAVLCNGGDATCVVNGGKFHGYVYNDSIMTIIGGTFNTDVSRYVHEECRQCTDGRVVPKVER